MGKKLISLSHQSWKTALLLYTKVVTFIFALFCVASGQLPKTSNNDTEPFRFRGRALSSSDSTAFSNARILLTDGLFPLYGIGSGPWFFDTTYSDENGYFEFEPNEMWPYCGQVVAEQSDESGEKEFFGTVDEFVCFGDYIFNDDSVYTCYLYLVNISLSVNKQSNKNVTKQLQITQGSKISVNYSEWSGDEMSDISVFDPKGNVIAKLQSRPEGIVSWDTRGVARGIYFIRLRSGLRNVNLRLSIK